MHVPLLLLCAAASLSHVSADAASLEELHKRVLALQTQVDSVLRQSLLINMGFEEKIRGDGDSGIKKVIVLNDGTKSYYSESTSYSPRYSILHPNVFQVNRMFSLSMQAVLNGVEFRQGGISVYMKQPNIASKDYLKTEDIKMPPVPPQVLAKKTVQEQTTEMLEWFKAFRDNNYKTRDFRKHFIPNICYLEGWWEKIDQRSFVKTNYKHMMLDMVYSIRRSYWPRSVLPRTIWKTGKELEHARWMSRIMCQPMKDFYISPNRFIPIDDIGARLAANQTFDEYKQSSQVRFHINPIDSDRFSDRYYRTGLLDKMMTQIPGLDNHVGNLRDTAFDSPVYSHDNSKQMLNTAFYHRFYKVQRAGAMGQFVRHRSYSDSSVFMAQTSQEKVAGVTLEDCKYVKGKGRVCKTYMQKFTYAIPLAVMYLNPLNSWNPYNLPLMDTKTLRANGRSGGNSMEKAFLGYAKSFCSVIPREFFEKRVLGEGFKRIMSGGKLHIAGGCGHRVRVEPIGLGKMRLIFPIYPTHGDGESRKKDAEALEDIIMEAGKYSNLLRGK